MLQDTVGLEEDGFALARSRAVLGALMCGLSPRLREIVRLRFHEDLTQAQIGERPGVSQMQVSRLLRHALQTLRDSAGGELLTGGVSLVQRGGAPDG
jgi:RNA polymerase sigma-B factor